MTKLLLAAMTLGLIYNVAVILHQDALSLCRNDHAFDTCLVTLNH